MHATQALEPLMAAKEPAAQSAHDVAPGVPEKRPAGHDVQVVAPEPEKVPTVHNWQPVDPVVLAKRPGAQL